MPSAILKGATGQPGPAGYPSGITTGIFNELNFVIPDYIAGIVAKYGNSSYMIASEILGNSTVEKVNTTTNTYSHFEKGRPFGSAIVANAVTGITAGQASITITLKSPQSYNNAAGTQIPFIPNQVVKLRSSGQKAQVLSINSTTPGAYTMAVKPLSATALFITGTTGTTINAGEGIENIR